MSDSSIEVIKFRLYFSALTHVYYTIHLTHTISYKNGIVYKIDNGKELTQIMTLSDHDIKNILYNLSHKTLNIIVRWDIKHPIYVTKLHLKYMFQNDTLLGINFYNVGPWYSKYDIEDFIPQYTDVIYGKFIAPQDNILLII